MDWDGADDCVALPPALLARVERRVQQTDFDSADEYVATALEEVLYYVESAGGDGQDRPTPEDVEDRLRSLGYVE